MPLLLYSNHSNHLASATLTIKRFNSIPFRCLFRSKTTHMAKSKYEYVKSFELHDELLPSTFIVLRVDGQNFHRFSDTHAFKKPNDLQALQLMNETAKNVMRSMKGLILGYGQSDEYSFILPSNTTLFQRRSSKLVSTVASLFSSYYTFLWPTFKPDTRLTYPPSFDCRAVLYPNLTILRDYLSWRQADCHINNLYNSCFWNLVQTSGLSRFEAEKRLAGTSSGDKNELLFSTFNINYNKIDEIYRKGTLIMPSGPDFESLHIDLISDPFWNQYGHLFK